LIVLPMFVILGMALGWKGKIFFSGDGGFGKDME